MAYPYDGMFYPTLPEDAQDFPAVLRGIQRTLADRARLTAQSIIESGQRAEQLQREAFPDPTRPTQLQNPEALAKLTEMIMGGPMGLAQMGMTKATGSDLTQTYQQISNKVDELYKRMQQESSNSSLLNEYKNLRAQRDELGAKLPPEAQQVEQSLLEQSYKGSHTAPKVDVYGATFDNLQGIMPSNVYSQEGKRLYGLGDSKVDSEWYMSALRVKGKPDADVTIYRAVPKGVKDINDGDWVTPSKEYARLHGERTLDGDYEILSKKVKARTLSTEGYPYELGYNEIVVK